MLITFEYGTKSKQIRYTGTSLSAAAFREELGKWIGHAVSHDDIEFITTDVVGQSKRCNVDHNDDIPVGTHELHLRYKGRQVLHQYQAPANNSCLFWSISFLICNQQTSQTEMRSMVVKHIEDNPEIYSDAVLDTSREEYMKWIMRPESWGGYIELGILAEVFKTQIVAFDTRLRRHDIYGECYRTRIFLIYDGSHYDALAASRSDVSEQPQYDSLATQFSVDDEEIFQQASLLAESNHQRSMYL